MLLVKTPVPDPSVVWLPEISGFGEVLQQTPLAVTLAPPSSVTFPPEVAVVEVMFVGAVVVRVGATAGVSKVRSSP
jgi:hypothetical protein